jgi:two-component system, NarL family, nitrate/nitrite response regulator NarL
VRLVICDDQRLLIEALAAVLTARGHVVEAVAYTPEEAVRAVASYDPDVCLLDVNLLGATEGIDVARRLRAEHPRTKVVILSALGEPSVVAEAIDAGVAGFVSKGLTVDSILSTLERVEAGEMAVEPDLLRAAVRQGSRAAHREHDGLLTYLTPRERYVLLLLVDGHSTAEIAQKMAISPSTARTHVQNVLVKLGAHSRLQAASMIATRGLLDQLRSSIGA